jgi:hypothetical protein
MSLPSPLTASDEWIKPHDTTIDVVRVTAGLHRQVWVSGTSIYVDVHIVNNSRKTIRKIELQLERDILCYKHVCRFVACALISTRFAEHRIGCRFDYGEIRKPSSDLRPQRALHTQQVLDQVRRCRLA